MMQPLEPSFLLSDVPGDVAVAVGGFGALAITSLAATVMKLFGWHLEEDRKNREVNHDLADAVKELAREQREANRRAS